MEIFECPCCHNPSVVWDARVKEFLCRNPDCAIAFPPLPPTTPNRPEEIILRLSWNMVPRDEIRDWLEQNHHTEQMIRMVAQ